jgi:hypothetical protein
MDAARRELRVKVWEQKKARSGASAPEEKPLPGPAPAVEQSPFASVDFGVEEQTVKDDELESSPWQKPLSPLPESRAFSASREEKSSSEPAEKKSWGGAKKRAEGELEKQLSQRGQGDPTRDGPQEVLKEKRDQSPQREALQAKSERHIQEEPGQGESKRQSQPQAKEDEQTLKATEDQPDIEDLPTLRLAVPEGAKAEPSLKAEPSIKIERASTPAPQKWSVPRTDEIDVEDLPTRPMAASPGGSATSRATQAAASSSDQGTAQPSPSSGALDAPLATPSTKRNEDADGDAFVSRSRTAHASAPTSITFDPASLPPLPPGSLPGPGGSLPHPEMQGPPGVQARRNAPSGAPGQSAPQRPLSFEAAPDSAPTTANAPRAATSGQVSAKKTPGKKHTGRLIVIIVLILVLVGGGVGIALKWDWVMQYFQPPLQNQPYQAYQNSSLGFSLEYTQHWNVSVDQAHNAVHFADSSYTGQVNVTVATATGQVSEYLNQQAVQLGITAPKATAAATFGASSWQVLQGTVTQEGASYIAMLYATQHNGHFYLLEFLAPAPQANFRAIDQSDFAHMRSTFKFL